MDMGRAGVEQLVSALHYDNEDLDSIPAGGTGFFFINIWAFSPVSQVEPRRGLRSIIKIN